MNNYIEKLDFPAMKEYTEDPFGGRRYSGIDNRLLIETINKLIDSVNELSGSVPEDV